MKSEKLSLPAYIIEDQPFIVNEGEARYHLRVADLPVEEKPREKMLAHGAEALSLSELFAVVLNTGTRREGVLAMSKRIMSEYGEKALLSQQNPKVLAEALDLPLGKACQVVACFEVGRRLFREDSRSHQVFLRTAKDVAAYAHDMAALPKEVLRGLYLNSRYQLIHDEVITMGSVTTNIVHPREVFRPALAYAASAVILVHNHPSDDTTASAADREATAQVAEAGRLLGIELLDHVIIARDGFTSILHRAAE